MDDANELLKLYILIKESLNYDVTLNNIRLNVIINGDILYECGDVKLILRNVYEGANMVLALFDLVYYNEYKYEGKI